MDIPVYLVAGFLDAGKTNFINGILEDGFAREDKRRARRSTRKRRLTTSPSSPWTTRTS